MAEDNKTLEEKIELLEQENEKLKEGNKLRSDAKLTEEERLEIKQKELKTAADRLIWENQINEIYGSQMEMMESSVEFLEKINALQTAGFGQEEVAAQLGLTNEQLEQMKAKAEAAKQKLEELGPAGVRSFKMMKPLIEDAATKLGLFSSKANGVFKSIVSIGQAARSKNGIKGMAMAFKETINPTNIALSVVSKIIEATFKYALAVDEATASFAKNTGMGRIMTSEIADVGAEMRHLGVSAKEAGEAAEGLVDVFPMFQNVSSSTRKEMIATVAGLKRLGASTQDAAGMITFYTQNLGMTEERAVSATKKLSMMGKTLGMSVKRITKDFNVAMKTLAVYGDRAEDVFEGLAAMAGTAGVKMESLLGMAKKFDEFGSAAESAAKMNAVLGTSLSGTNLMMMDEQQRIEEVIRSVQAMGTPFSQLDKYTHLLIMQTAGINDVTEAQKILE